ncbi:MAG: peptidoglycan-associated lipoprotein Pal [Kiloniellales bacterium]|nr:peptidoglycan-associated lipoprotein Pal [Kiloniellales bacterium]
MRFKLLSVFAAMLLVAGCETAPQETTEGAATTTITPSAPPRTPEAESDQENLLINVGDRIFFDFDKYDLKPESQETLQKLAAWMEERPRTTITIEGHADERGTREYNLALGERRANAARDYLMALGVSGGRVLTISYGKERPAVLGSNEAAWAQNRRDVFVVN